ncbi:hypothetical protein FACS1894137_02340 [Spirochaetia bacterium]|nr:hypothetical protein FACS1894137_02340 [Spirochaetia bacterium]
MQKKRIVFPILLMMLGMSTVWGGGNKEEPDTFKGNDKPSQNSSLEQAVQASAKTIATKLPQGAKTAILSFTASSQEFSDYIIDELAIALAANKISVFDRQYTDDIRKELKFQRSGEVSDDEVKRVGIQLGAQYIITGSLVDIGNAYRFRVIAINVETAGREGASINININDPQVGFLLTGKRQPVSNTGGVQTAQTGNSGQEYKIGDFGPAGGIVFYDKGVFSAGWRYLEAAPPETEFTAQWGAYGKEVSGTAQAVGSGKRNTEVIVDRLRQLDESDRAAQLCATLDFDGFKDWFLPSKDELNFMYTNLKVKGLGGFQNAEYWSSSEYSNNGAWYQVFSDGRQKHYYDKVNTFCVRAVRAF